MPRRQFPRLVTTSSLLTTTGAYGITIGSGLGVSSYSATATASHALDVQSNTNTNRGGTASAFFNAGGGGPITAIASATETENAYQGQLHIDINGGISVRLTETGEARVTVQEGREELFAASLAYLESLQHQQASVISEPARLAIDTQRKTAQEIARLLSWLPRLSRLPLRDSKPPENCRSAECSQSPSLRISLTALVELGKPNIPAGYRSHRPRARPFSESLRHPIRVITATRPWPAHPDPDFGSHRSRRTRATNPRHCAFRAHHLESHYDYETGTTPH
jgi:hypothetical protein